jgi:hypothetical protein
MVEDIVTTAHIVDRRLKSFAWCIVLDIDREETIVINREGTARALEYVVILDIILYQILASHKEDTADDADDDANREENLACLVRGSRHARRNR